MSIENFLGNNNNFSSLTKSERKQLKKEQNLKKKEQLQKIKYKNKLIKNSIKYFIIVIILTFISYSLFLLFESSSIDQSNRFKEGNVHWHAKLAIFVCGEYKSLENLGTKEHHAGLPLFHTHGDNLIHIEGEPLTYEDINLGKFFEAINIPFANNKIMDKTNGDKCLNGKQGNLTILLNKKLLENPVNYSVKDNDEFEIRFE